MRDEVFGTEPFRASTAISADLPYLPQLTQNHFGEGLPHNLHAGVHASAKQFIVCKACCIDGFKKPYRPQQSELRYFLHDVRHGQCKVQISPPRLLLVTQPPVRTPSAIDFSFSPNRLQQADL